MANHLMMMDKQIVKLESDLRRLRDAYAKYKRAAARELKNRMTVCAELQGALDEENQKNTRLMEENMRLMERLRVLSQEGAARCTDLSKKCSVSANYPWIGENANLKQENSYLKMENARLKDEINKLRGGLHPFQCHAQISAILTSNPAGIDTQGEFIHG